MSADRTRVRSGVTVIEVLLGFVILSIAGVGLVTLLGQGSHSMENIARTERETRSAAALLDRYSLASRADLLAQLGARRISGFEVALTKEGRGLFVVTLGDTSSRAVLLRTAFYRPDSAHATP
jgi:type II secretory pathway pseudopilin PulG